MQYPFHVNRPAVEVDLSIHKPATLRTFLRDHSFCDSICLVGLLALIPDDLTLLGNALRGDDGRHITHVTCDLPITSAGLLAAFVAAMQDTNVKSIRFTQPLNDPNIVAGFNVRGSFKKTKIESVVFPSNLNDIYGMRKVRGNASEWIPLSQFGIAPCDVFLQNRERFGPSVMPVVSRFAQQALRGIPARPIPPQR